MAAGESSVNEMRSQLNECLRELQFATTEIIFLGRDRNGSEYFLASYESNRLYVRFKRFFCDPVSEYRMYEGIKQISEIMKKDKVMRGKLPEVIKVGVFEISCKEMKEFLS